MPEIFDIMKTEQYLTGIMRHYLSHYMYRSSPSFFIASNTYQFKDVYYCLSIKNLIFDTDSVYII